MVSIQQKTKRRRKRSGRERAGWKKPRRRRRRKKKEEELPLGIAPPSNPIPRRLVWWQWVSDLKSQMREIGFRFVDRKRESSAGVLEVRD